MFLGDGLRSQGRGGYFWELEQVMSTDITTSEFPEIVMQLSADAGRQTAMLEHIDRVMLTLPTELQGPATADIFDISGHSVLMLRGLTVPTVEMNCSGLQTGLCLVRITDRNGRSFSTTFVVEH